MQQPPLSTSLRSPKMVIAIEHSYAKNWQDVAFSPWNASPSQATMGNPLLELLASAGDDVKKIKAEPESTENDHRGFSGWSQTMVKSEPEVKPKLELDVKITELKVAVPQSPIIAEDLKTVGIHGHLPLDNTGSEPAFGWNLISAAKSRLQQQGRCESKPKRKGSKKKTNNAALTRLEVEGLRSILENLSKHDPPQEVPDLIKDPGALIRDGWDLVQDLESTIGPNSNSGITGVPLLNINMKRL